MKSDIRDIHRAYYRGNTEPLVTNEEYFERAADSPPEPDDTAQHAAQPLRKTAAQQLRPGDGGAALRSEPGVWLSEVALEPEPPFLITPFWPEAPTILFGPGGVGKGLIAAWWVSLLTANGQRVAVLDFEGNVEEWQGRIARLGGDLSKVLYKNGDSTIWRLAPDIATQFEELAGQGTPIAAAVVDSATTACGSGNDSDVSGPETVTRYKQALGLLGVPTLTLAHVTKAQAQSGEPARFPFGSVFWHNLARMTWAIVPAGSETDHTMRLVNQKASRWQRSPDVFLRAEWGDERITIMPLDAPPGGLVLWQQMVACLEAEGPLTPKELAARLEVEDNQIRAEFGRHPANFVKTGDRRMNAEVWRPRRGHDDTGGPDPQSQTAAFDADDQAMESERSAAPPPPYAQHAAPPAEDVPVEDDPSAHETDEEESK